MFQFSHTKKFNATWENSRGVIYFFDPVYDQIPTSKKIIYLNGKKIILINWPSLQKMKVIKLLSLRRLIIKVFGTMMDIFLDDV